MNAATMSSRCARMAHRALLASTRALLVSTRALLVSAIPVFCLLALQPASQLSLSSLSSLSSQSSQSSLTLSSLSLSSLPSPLMLFPATQAQQLESAPLNEEQKKIVDSDRFRRLASELRCLVCQNQTLADSNAPLAMDLRRQVVELIQSGRNDDEVRAWLVDRYGEFVLYKPTMNLRNALLWGGPFVLLLIGAWVWWRMGRRVSTPDQSADDALRQVDELLKR